MAEVPSTRSMALGTPAPDFRLPDLDGKHFGLADIRGPKGLVIAFVCNHCPFVLHLAEELGVFAETCIAQGVGFAGINSNDAARYPADSPENMKQMARRYHWHFPYLFDADQGCARSYMAACTPDFYVFDEQLHLAYCGQFDDSRPGNGKPVSGADLRAAVRAVISHAPPPATQRPSTGCSIKWQPGNEPPWFAH